MSGIGGLVLFSSQSGVFQIPTCGALICGDTHQAITVTFIIIFYYNYFYL